MPFHRCKQNFFKSLFKRIKQQKISKKQKDKHFFYGNRCLARQVNRFTFPSQRHRYGVSNCDRDKKLIIKNTNRN